jgi:AraC family transcriptional regulator
VDSPHSLESNSHPHEERLSSIPSTSHDRIIQLLATAMSNLYGNRMLANDCIVSASALLRISAVRGLSRSEGSPPMGGLAPWQAKRVRAYITAHIATKIRASELAEHISLSTSHFFRAFRETFGEAPMAYVASERMRHAQALLLTTEESLSQVLRPIRSGTFHSNLSPNRGTYSERVAAAIFSEDDQTNRLKAERQTPSPATIDCRPCHRVPDYRPLIRSTDERVATPRSPRLLIPTSDLREIPSHSTDK